MLRFHPATLRFLHIPSGPCAPLTSESCLKLPPFTKPKGCKVFGSQLREICEFLTTFPRPARTQPHAAHPHSLRLSKQLSIAYERHVARAHLNKKNARLPFFFTFQIQINRLRGLPSPSLSRKSSGRFGVCANTKFKSDTKNNRKKFPQKTNMATRGVQEGDKYGALPLDWFFGSIEAACPPTKASSRENFQWQQQNEVKCLQ